MKFHKNHLFVAAFFVIGFSFSNQTWAGFNEGVAEFKRGNYQGALKEWQPLAEAGDGEAANAIGALYDRGLGVKENDQEAAKWYEIAANAGQVQGMRNLANLYSLGQGVAYDMSQARFWYEKAAELGDQAAIRRLAKINNRPLPPEAVAAATNDPANPSANAANASFQSNGSNTGSLSLSIPKNDNDTQTLASANAPDTSTPPTSTSSAVPSSPTPQPVHAVGTNNSTVEDLRTKPVEPAPPKNGPIGPSVKAAPVPKVQETELAEPASSAPANNKENPPLSTSEPSSSLLLNSGAAVDNTPADNTPAPQQTANIEPQPAIPTVNADPSNWLIGQWQGPSLGCPPRGGLAFTPDTVDTYYNGKVIVRLKAHYKIDGDSITVSTVGLDGTNQDYVYRRLDAERFVIDKVPSAMPASLVGAEHKKCNI